MKKLPCALALTLVALVLVGESVAGSGRPFRSALGGTAQLPESARAVERPSIVVIMTDDQRWDTLWAMPTVERELVGRGVTFTNAFVTNPLCCPSKVTFLSGGYSHDHGVYKNGGRMYGPSSFDDSSTIATWLQDAGYTTAFIGKYLYGIQHRVPPGWSHWYALGAPRYYNYTVNDDGTTRRLGAQAEDYSTDVLASEATSFIRDTDGPLFVLLSLYAPHVATNWRATDPIPAPRHLGTFAGHEPARPPSFDEADVSDKPSHIRRRALDQELIDKIDELGRAQLEALQAVDQGVAAVLDALSDTGRLGRAVIVFTSDNGFSLGEHRWVAKWVPYEESIRVPLVVRHDPMIRGRRSDGNLVANVDLAPTLAALGRASAPAMSGKSLVPLLASGGSRWRSDFVLERSGSGVPSYCGIRSRTYLYVQYETGFEEIYDLDADPFQLENLAAVPASRRRTVGFRGRLHAICRPPPPGMRLLSECLVSGSAGPDLLAGTRWYDLICGGGGNDRISARAGEDWIEGAAGADVVSGGKGGDRIWGSTGKDRLRGGDGADLIVGGADADDLSGDGEADVVLAGSGADLVRAAHGGPDFVNCGPGEDTAVVDATDRVLGCENVRVRNPETIT